MNSHQLFWNNKRMQQAAQKVFQDFLTARVKGDIKAKEPVQVHAELPFEVQNFSLIRLNGKKWTAPVCLGSTQPDFAKRLYELVTPEGGPTPDSKSVEGELMKGLFGVVDSELKANSITLDPKSIVCLPQKLIGAWGSVSVTHAVQFPFTTPKGDVTFEIPAFDNEFSAEKTFTTFGFPESSRILVVDDAPTSRKLVTYYLNSMGYTNLDECPDGSSALNKLLGSRPPFDLVVADWHMPNMTGLELLKKIRTSQDINNMPVILVTGERNQEEVITAMKERVSGYVVKPFDGETLYKAMKKAAQTAAAAQAAAKKAG